MEEDSLELLHAQVPNNKRSICAEMDLSAIREIIAWVIIMTSKIDFGSGIAKCLMVLETSKSGSSVVDLTEDMSMASNNRCSN